MTESRKHTYIFRKSETGHKLIRKWLQEDPEYDISTWKEISKTLEKLRLRNPDNEEFSNSY